MIHCQAPIPAGLGFQHTYPDIVVVCGQPRFLDGEADTLLNPVILIELLSPSTKDCDRGSKFERYRTIPSLGDYVVIAQERPQVEHHARQPDGRWLLSDVRALEDSVRLTAVDGELQMADICQGVIFD